MATKKNEESSIQDAEFIEVANTPDKIIHEVEVELTDNFLEKNPTLKDIYENGKLKIGLLPNISNEFSEEIIKLIPELNSQEIALFNPLIETINVLASYDYIVGTVKPEKQEDQDEKEYDKVIKKWMESEKERYMGVSNDIKAFNGTTTKTKKELKDPILERGRKIDALYNTLKAFSEKRREKVSENFKPFLDSVEELKKKKQEAIDKKNKEQIDQLTQASQEANAKLQASEKKNSYADKILEISQYFTDAQSKIGSLNTSGLLELKEEVEGKTFDFSDFGPMEQANLSSNENTFRTGTLALINQAISQEETGSQKSEEQQFENQQNLPNAHVAETLYGGSGLGTQATNYQPTFNTEVKNDADNFASIIMKFNIMIGEIDSMKEFTDPMLVKMNATFNDQKTSLKENIKKLSEWIGKKQELYNQHKQ